MVRVTNYMKRNCKISLSDILEKMDRDLGGSFDTHGSTHNNNPSSADALLSLLPNQSMIVCLSGEKREKKVAACVLSRPLDWAHRRSNVLDGDNSLPIPLNQDLKSQGGEEGHTPAMLACKLGVDKVWVHKEFRRTGVASRLLDTLRHNFSRDGTCAGVLKADVAFSQTTDDGKRLAAKYTGSVDFLTYRG
jgi:GNAT superfamily N-acetyltransferase